MSVIYDIDKEYKIYTKGSLEIVLKRVILL